MADSGKRKTEEHDAAISTLAVLTCTALRGTSHTDPLRAAHREAQDNYRNFAEVVRSAGYIKSCACTISHRCIQHAPCSTCTFRGTETRASTSYLQQVSVALVEVLTLLRNKL